MSEEMNLFQKLAKIRKQVEVMQKNKAGFNYKYVSEEEILAKITAFMDKYGISLIPSIVPDTMEHEQYHYVKTKLDKSSKQYYDEHNNEIIVRADMVYTWVNNENPSEKIEVPWGMIGQQADSSQAFGSGLTYGGRYFLLKYFNVATPDDDPDNWRSKQRAAEQAEDLALSKAIIQEFDEAVKAFLADNPGEGENVKKLASKYVKDGNYFAIKESVLATKLLTDFKDKFLSNKED